MRRDRDIRPRAGVNKPPVDIGTGWLSLTSVRRSTSRRQGQGQAQAQAGRSADGNGDGDGTKEPGKRPASRQRDWRRQLARRVRPQRAAAAA